VGQYCGIHLVILSYRHPESRQAVKQVYTRHNQQKIHAKPTGDKQHSRTRFLRFSYLLYERSILHDHPFIPARLILYPKRYTHDGNRLRWPIYARTVPMQSIQNAIQEQGLPKSSNYKSATVPIPIHFVCFSVFSRTPSTFI
jgi:hypothetical protein